MANTSPAPVELDYGELLKKSWEIFTKYPIELIVGGFLGVLLCIPIITAGPAITGISRLGLNAARDNNPSIGDVFSGFKQFVPSLIASLLCFLIVVVGMVLLIIPGIVAGFLLGLTFFYLADDEECTSAEAMKASVRLVKANVVPFLITLIITTILGFVGNILVIGTLVTSPMGLVYYALVYDQLKGSVPDNPHHAVMP